MNTDMQYHEPSSVHEAFTTWMLDKWTDEDETIPPSVRGVLIDNHSGANLELIIATETDNWHITVPDKRQMVIQPKKQIEITYTHHGGHSIPDNWSTIGEGLLFYRFLSVDEIDKLLAPQHVTHIKGAQFSCHQRKGFFERRTPFGVGMILSKYIKQEACDSQYAALVPKSTLSSYPYAHGTFDGMIDPLV